MKSSSKKVKVRDLVIFLLISIAFLTKINSVDAQGKYSKEVFERRLVKFNFNSAKLTKDAIRTLNEQLLFLQAYDNVELMIIAHCMENEEGCLGTPNEPNNLGLKRAIAVSQYLKERTRGLTILDRSGEIMYEYNNVKYRPLSVGSAHIKCQHYSDIKVFYYKFIGGVKGCPIVTFNVICMSGGPSSQIVD